MIVALTKSSVGSVKLLCIQKDDKKSIRYRWITREKNGRFYGRAPKVGVLVRDLDKKRETDFGPERVLPLQSHIYKTRHSRRKIILKTDNALRK